MLSREAVERGLVPHAIPLLAGQLSDYAVFALRKVAEERIGQLTDALLDPARMTRSGGNSRGILSVGVSQRAADALLLALDDDRFDVRYQAARSLAAISAETRESASIANGYSKWCFGKWRSGAPSGRAAACSMADVNESPLDEFVRDRAGQSLAHVFTFVVARSAEPAAPNRLPQPPQPEQPPSRHGPRVPRRRASGRHSGQRLWPFLVQGRATGPVQPHDEIIAESPSVQLLGDPPGRSRQTPGAGPVLPSSQLVMYPLTTCVG